MDYHHYDRDVSNKGSSSQGTRGPSRWITVGNEDNLEKLSNRHARELVIWVLLYKRPPSLHSKNMYERSMYHFLKDLRVKNPSRKVYASSKDIVFNNEQVNNILSIRFSIKDNANLEVVHNRMVMELVDFIWENKRLPKHISMKNPPAPSVEKRLREFLNQWKQAYRGGVKAKHYQSSYDIIVDAGLAEIVESKPLTVVRRKRAPNKNKKLPRTYFSIK